MDEFDIHNRKRDYERAVAKVKNSDLPEKNKQLILEFQEECFSNGLSLDRVLFYLNRLYRLAQFLKKDFTKATKPDIKDLEVKRLISKF